MTITAEVYAHVLPAVQLILADLNGAADGATGVDQLVHARLWPYVTHALQEIRPAPAATPAKIDGRAKPWTCVVRFWDMAGPTLIAETDPETVMGTGTLPAIVAAYGAEMHGETPPELSEEAVKAQLPQLRNNLGRQGSAVLRIEYGNGSALCQVDVSKL